MTNLDTAWLAGLLEGEGYFQITKPRHHHPTQVVIRLSMTDEDVVKKVAKLLSVPVNHKARTTKRKAIYSISLSKRDEVEKVLLQILPFMGSRRAQRIHECLDAIRKRRQVIAETRKEQQIRAANIRWNKTQG
jgi:hypothetical protein